MSTETYLRYEHTPTNCYMESSLPICSVVIPVYNNLRFTKSCVKTLFQLTPLHLFHTIIINNASSDGTKEFLDELQKTYSNVSIIHNIENLGFSKACNQGAKIANTKYLVFLNNDTLPLNGWLEELLSTAEEDEKIGVVGSKLLYPDNTIQHAGVVISQYPSPVSLAHIFKGLPSDFTPANIKKDYQIVTGACMLVRRQIFQDLGGFDESFINGFEDVDFCLRVREAGYRVVYNPKSVLYHYESKTEGRFLHETQNWKILYKKWQKKITPDPEVLAPMVHIMVINTGSLDSMCDCLKSLKENIAYKYRKVLALTSKNTGKALKRLQGKSLTTMTSEMSLLDDVITVSNNKNSDCLDLSKAIDYALYGGATYIWILSDRVRTDYDVLASPLLISYLQKQIGMFLIRLDEGTSQISSSGENLKKQLSVINDLQLGAQSIAEDISNYSLFISTDALLKSNIPPRALQFPSGINEILSCLIKNGWLVATLQ